MKIQVGDEVRFGIITGGIITQSRKIIALNKDGTLHCSRKILSSGEIIDEPRVTVEFWGKLKKTCYA